MAHAAAALQPALGLARVRREAVEAQAQVGPEPRPRRIVLLDDFFLERRGEEFLRQVGGLRRDRATT